MIFFVNKNGKYLPWRDEIAQKIIKTLLQHGHQIASGSEQINFAFNLTDIQSPQIFRRNSQAVFVISIIQADKTCEQLRSLCYRTLVRSLSNLLICVVPPNGSAEQKTSIQPEIYFTTPEAGFYHLPFENESVYENILPIAGAHFAIENRLEIDLPQRFWRSSKAVEQICKYGKVLDKLGVLPAPFPLRQILPEEDIAHLYKLFEVKGLSYGNLSAREQIQELGNKTFWMTARGIDKAKISTPGKDILLVKGIEKSSGRILVSVPPDFDPFVRVSVDGVEHALIYQEFPEVGAIVHCHAWMENVLCTHQNFPCGTIELAEEVIGLLWQTGNPGRTVVGLKNHGLTITGPSLDDIFNRIDGKLLTEVPMFV